MQGRTAILACLLLVGLGSGPSRARQADAQEAAEKEPAPSPVSIESISIEPAAPAADTLCQLRVKLENSGARPISAVDFGVAVGGVDLGV